MGEIPADERGDDYADLEVLARAEGGMVSLGMRLGPGMVSCSIVPARARNIARYILEACDEADRQMPQIGDGRG